MPWKEPPGPSARESAPFLPSLLVEAPAPRVVTVVRWRRRWRRRLSPFVPIGVRASCAGAGPARRCRRRRPVARGRAGERAPPAPADCRTQSDLPANGPNVHRLQGLVPHPCCDPLRAYSRYLLAGVILPPRTEEVCNGGAHGLPETIRSDNGSPFADGRGRSVPVVGWLAQGRHCAGTDRPGPAPAERAARAHAQDLGDRDDQAAGCEHGAPRTASRPLPPGLQRQPAPRGAACGSTGAYPERLQEPWYDGTPCAGCTARSSGAATFPLALAGEPVGIAGPVRFGHRPRAIAGRKDHLAPALLPM